MKQSFLEKLDRVEAIAAEDEICQDYANTIAHLQGSYDRLLRVLPRPLRRRIEGYAGYRAMLLERKLVLACQNMEFTQTAEEEGNGR